MDTTDIRASVRQFIVTNYLLGDEEISFLDTDSFLESGITDSTGILELIEFIESSYDLHISDTEMIPENLDSVENVCAFVLRKTHKI